MQSAGGAPGGASEVQRPRRLGTPCKLPPRAPCDRGPRTLGRSTRKGGGGLCRWPYGNRSGKPWICCQPNSAPSARDSMRSSTMVQAAVRQLLPQAPTCCACWQAVRKGAEQAVRAGESAP